MEENLVLADVIKIPYGFVIATTNDEWASICASIKAAIRILEGADKEDEIQAKQELERLLFDLLSPKSKYGSENMN